MPRLVGIISEAIQARHAAANKPARFNEWLDVGPRWFQELDATEPGSWARTRDSGRASGSRCEGRKCRIERSGGGLAR